MDFLHKTSNRIKISNGYIGLDNRFYYQIIQRKKGWWIFKKITYEIREIYAPNVKTSFDSYDEAIDFAKQIITDWHYFILMGENK